MPSGLVLVIEDDEWVARLLTVSMRESGFDTIVCGSGEEGLITAIERSPDCIVCDVDLPDHDGFWVARSVRTHPSRIAVTPFLFLSGLDDQASRLAGFHVGADVYMTKPFRVDEVVAQVGALVQMASRLRERHSSFLSMQPEEASAIEGDLGQMSIATLLTVLEMERRTGVFEVVSKKQRAQLDLANGCVVSGTVGGEPVPSMDALRLMLRWKVGRFSFAPEPPRDPADGVRATVGALLLEALRIEDETRRDESERVRVEGISGAGLGIPSLGGPPTTVEDVAPPSTRLVTSAASTGEWPTTDEDPFVELVDAEEPEPVPAPPPRVEALPPPPLPGHSTRPSGRSGTLASPVKPPRPKGG